MNIERALLVIVLIGLFLLLIWLAIGNSSEKIADNNARHNDDDYIRATMSRRDYYRDVYLKSEAWQRKRYVVLKRDNWTCRKCGGKATDVHHERYARKIGTEPIKWLIAICRPCHVAIHGH